MILDDQNEAIAFLERQAKEAGGSLETISTHISRVFLAGERVLKLKRAVAFPYLDFSTPERRLAACRAEMELNRRTAPDLYLRVRRLTRGAQGIEWDGEGPLVDAVIEMRRFDQDLLFDNMARRGALTAPVMTELARAIAAFHRDAAVSRQYGGAAGMAAVLDINDRALRSTGLVADALADDLASRFRSALDRHADVLDARRAAGKVRRCHGDLILRNICLLDGRPTMFDCIEFDDAIATIDILYDLSFLLMDLWARGQRHFANLVFNRYLDECDEVEGASLMPFFMAVRAAVRAHVAAAQIANAAPGDADMLRREASAYLDLAQSLLEPARTMCIAIGGLSGSGKSTASARIAPEIWTPPGARTLNSDRIRKALFGVSPETRLPASAYAPEVSQRVYDALRHETGRCLRARWPAVADAVFDRPDERAAIEDVAAQAGVPFHGFWLEAPKETLLARIAARRSDPSDATAEVLESQSERDRGDIAWTRIDAEGGPDATGLAIIDRLKPGPS